MVYFAFGLMILIYLTVGILWLCKYIRMRRKYMRLTTICSCKSAATVLRIEEFDPGIFTYTLDYYDAHNKRYIVEVSVKGSVCKFFLKQIVEIYYNPADNYEVNIPMVSSKYTGFDFDMAGKALLYVIVGFLIAVWFAASIVFAA